MLKKQLSYSRMHWAIENNLHRVLDVVFKEDNSPVYKQNAAENTSTIRKIVFNLVRNYKNITGDKSSIPTIRMAAGWDDQTALAIITKLVR
jgi:hypothetical protein